MRDFANCRSDSVIDDEEIVVRVERQMIGVERPFGLFWRTDEFLSKGPGNGEQDAA